MNMHCFLLLTIAALSGANALAPSKPVPKSPAARKADREKWAKEAKEAERKEEEREKAEKLQQGAARKERDLEKLALKWKQTEKADKAATISATAVETFARKNPLDRIAKSLHDDLEVSEEIRAKAKDQTQSANQLLAQAGKSLKSSEARSAWSKIEEDNRPAAKIVKVELPVHNAAPEAPEHMTPEELSREARESLNRKETNAAYHHLEDRVKGKA